MVALIDSVRHSLESHRRVHMALLAAGLASSILYAAVDVIGSRRYPGYSSADQAFSELTAQGLAGTHSSA